MNIDPNASLLLVAVAIQIVAAYFSFVIFRFNRLSTNWLALTWGIMFIALGTTLSILAEYDTVPAFTRELLFTGQIAIPILASLLMAFGLWGMKKNFEYFEVVEKEATTKVRSLEVMVGSKGKKGKK